MNCRDCGPLVSPYVDDELSGDQKKAVAEHLASCPDCRETAEALCSLTDAAADLGPVTPSAETVLKISEQIHEAAPARRRTEFGPVLDVNELIDYLHIDEATLEIYLPELPSFELGGKLLFRTESVEQWIRRRERRAGFGAEPQAARPLAVDADNGGTTWTL